MVAAAPLSPLPSPSASASQMQKTIDNHLHALRRFAASKQPKGGELSVLIPACALAVNPLNLDPAVHNAKDPVSGFAARQSILLRPDSHAQLRRTCSSVASGGVWSGCARVFADAWVRRAHGARFKTPRFVMPLRCHRPYRAI